nr:MAG TPA: hypothetical protein [Crassvirales sp.]
MRGIFSCLSVIFWIAVLIVLLSGGTISDGAAFLGALVIIGVILLTAICIDLCNKPKKIKEPSKPTGKIEESSTEDVDLGNIVKYTPKVFNYKVDNNPTLNTSNLQEFKKAIFITTTSKKDTSKKGSNEINTSKDIIAIDREPQKNKLEEGVFSLTMEQRCALLKVALDLSYSSPNRLYLWKGQYEILLEFARTLELKEDQLEACILEIAEGFFRTSGDNINSDYYEVVRTITQDGPFIQLINICVKLLDFIDSLDDELIESESYAYLVFPKILGEIGFTQKEIEDLKYGEGIYRTRDGKNIIALQEQKEPQTNIEQEYPVSKEQMAIFKKNWTLPQFRKEFGVEDRVESRKNHTHDEDYKVCIFIKNSDGSEFNVGFSNSLGEPSIEEIQRREKELMVGLSYYGNYKLYDNQIPVLEKVDLGI